MPAGLAADRRIGLAEKCIIARIRSFKDGAWITSPLLARQLAVAPAWLRRTTGRLVKEGWLTSKPTMRGLRVLKLTQKAKDACDALAPCPIDTDVCPIDTDPCLADTQRIHIDNNENTNHTCSSEHEQTTSSKNTNPDQPIPNTQPGGLVCSKPVWGIGGNPGGITETPDVVPPLPAASGWDEYPDEDVEAAREEAYANRTIAFPERAALGLLEHKAKCRKQIFTG